MKKVIDAIENFDEVKRLIDEAHAKGMKRKAESIVYSDLAARWWHNANEIEQSSATEMPEQFGSVYIDKRIVKEMLITICKQMAEGFRQKGLERG